MFVLLGASYLMYNLAAVSGDPLEDLRNSTAPNREQLMDARIRLLDLDVPPPLRYFLWLSGVLKGFIGQLDLGLAINGTPVTVLLGNSVLSTLQLITASTVLAIVIGVSIGMTTALRQYSGYDYTVTFFSFLFFSLPVFWVGVLLKQWVAIGFNDFLQNPVIPWMSIVLIALGAGFVWMNILGGDLRFRVVSLAVSALITGGVLAYFQITDWFRTPALGPVIIALTGLGIAAVVTLLSTGLSNRRVLYGSLAVVALWVALWYPLQFVFTNQFPAWGLWVFILGGILVSGLVGFFFEKHDRGVAARTTAITGALVIGILIIDRVLVTWPAYVQNTGGRPIATIGSVTPGLNGSIWIGMVDSFTHLLLPTMTLLLISLATYSRYSRASLLEVMNQDYVRTARAKGLTERTVVMRHAFRNAMIPIATIIAFDVGALIGGAVITERVFAWKGMGSLFADALRIVDLNPVMGFFLVTAIIAVAFNLIADILYSILDPRIRVS